MSDYLRVNRAYWDERAPAHAASPDFAFDAYTGDPDRISDIVRFDLPLLGDVSGVDGVHLQCHIGGVTVSLARLGARMTGLDFSPASLVEARLAQLAGVDVPFVNGEVYQAVVRTDATFATTLTVEWNHGLGQIITALLDHGLHLTGLVEHDSLPWDALPGQMRPIGGGEYQLADRPWRLPHSYTLQARKPPPSPPAARPAGAAAGLGFRGRGRRR